MRINKLYIALVSAAAMVASCSSEDDIVMSPKPQPQPEVQVVDPDTVPQPILVGMGGLAVSTAVSETRGTGTVGDMTGSARNKWQSQHVKIFMLDKGTMNPTIFPDELNKPIYKNADFWTPGKPNTETPFQGVTDPLVGVVDSGIARPVDNRVRYYPPRGNSDFWGYRVDSCELAEPYQTDDAWKVDFKIDGSQDIMVARAIPSQEDIDSLGRTAGLDADANAVNRTRAYSGFAARHGIHPSMTFRHKLARLAFQIRPMLDKTVDPVKGITVDSISVASWSKGTLTIAKLNDPDGELQNIEWDKSSDKRDTLYLKQRAQDYDPTILTDSLNLVKLQSLDLKGKTKKQLYPIGESLLVAPDTIYRIRVHLTQMIEKYYDDPTDLKAQDYWYDDYITLPNNAPFLEGCSYKVNISLYGLETIKITTVLTGWNDVDEPIELQPEDEDDVPDLEP
jgi:hypothetical protein